MSKQISEYKVGDALYRYIEFGGVFKYIVVGRREYEGSVQLEVECQTCNHGWKCRLLIAQNDYGRIVSIHMLNNDDHDDQRCWHSQESGLYFHSTSGAANRERLLIMRKDAKERVEKAKGALKAAEERAAEIEEAISLASPSSANEKEKP